MIVMIYLRETQVEFALIEKSIRRLLLGLCFLKAMIYRGRKIEVFLMAMQTNDGASPDPRLC